MKRRPSSQSILINSIAQKADCGIVYTIGSNSLFWSHEVIASE